MKEDMNKEEFELKLQQFLNNQVYIMAYRFNYDSARIFNDELIDYIKELQQENEQLKEKIDKAVEYIEYNNEGLYTFEPDYDYEENIVDNYEPSSYREDLLEILKGDSNE